jgi:phage shock protein A
LPYAGPEIVLSAQRKRTSRRNTRQIAQRRATGKKAGFSFHPLLRPLRIGRRKAEELHVFLFFEQVVLRVLLWVGLPTLLVILAIGPRRTWHSLKRAWHWLWRRRLDPEEVLTQVVKQYEELVGALQAALAKSEKAEADLRRSIRQSEGNLADLEKQAKEAAAANDDLGARAVLYKLNLERQALAVFREQLERQKKQIDEIRKHLYLAELQLRQYEVGRSILLSQLAEAETAEQQYAIASHFDPFSAVANWQRAEGMVEEKALNARAVQRVFTDLADLPLPSQPDQQVDPQQLEAQLEELKQRARQLGSAG